MKAKHDELAKFGRAPGGRAPFGYRWAVVDEQGTRGYVVNPEEAEVVKLMARRVLEGTSLLRLARDLTRAGIPTREGRPWHSASARAVLVNPAIVGLRVHRREVAGPGNWEPILDRITWDAIEGNLKDPARKVRRPAQKFLLAGLVETCHGDPMIGSRASGPGEAVKGKERTATKRVYATKSGPGGSTREFTPPVVSMQIGADDLEAVVTEAVLTALDETELPDLSADQEQTAISADVRMIEEELAQLARLRGEGTITLEEWLAARSPLQRRLEDAGKAAGSVRSVPPVVRNLSARGAARRAWPSLELEDRRQIISAVIAKIVVAPATKGRWTPIEDRLSPESGFGIHWKV